MLQIFVLCVALFIVVVVAQAQEAEKISRIGFLSATPLSAIPARVDAFRLGLRELGHVEGKTIIIEFRNGEGTPGRLPAHAAELVRLKVDVIVTGGPTVTRAAKEATLTIPIVMAQDIDPIGSRLSLASHDQVET